MSQNDTLLSILTELQTSQATLAADLQKIIDAGGNSIPQSTLDSLQSVADAMKSNVDTIDAAINSPATTGK